MEFGLILFGVVQMMSLISYSKGNICQIDSSLQGVFMKQPDDSNTFRRQDNGMEGLITYDKLTITPSSASSWGNCYESVGDDSFIFGMKRIGDAFCYRCVTLVLRSANIIQAAHQTGNPCKGSIDEARKRCFDSGAISAAQGTLLYRVENEEAASCSLDGVFDVRFARMDSTISCTQPGSTMSNCESMSRLQLQFRNCSFPDFDLTLTCIGRWQAGANGIESYIAVRDNDSKQLKCGILVETGRAEKTLHLSRDANCEGLTSNGGKAAEEYTFTRRETRENWATCTFPEWLEGAYRAVTISERAFSYSDGTSDAVPTISYCLTLEGQRVAVFTESTCGEFIGFHCLWFRSRSDSLVEFKTTDRRDEDDGTLCSDESAFEFSPWTAIVAQRPDPVDCGLDGTYVTPRSHRLSSEAACYRLTTDCSSKHSLKVIAFNCETEAVFETRRYTCLGSWSEQGYLFVYTQRVQHNVDVCFVTRQHKGLLYVSTSGVHCQRNYNFTLNSDKTIVLERESVCNSTELANPTAKNQTAAANLSTAGGSFPIEQSINEGEGGDPLVSEISGQPDVIPGDETSFVSEDGFRFELNPRNKSLLWIGTESKNCSGGNIVVGASIRSLTLVLWAYSIVNFTVFIL